MKCQQLITCWNLKIVMRCYYEKISIIILSFSQLSFIKHTSPSLCALLLTAVIAVRRAVHQACWHPEGYIRSILKSINTTPWSFVFSKISINIHFISINVGKVISSWNQAIHNVRTKFNYNIAIPEFEFFSEYLPPLICLSWITQVIIQSTSHTSNSTSLHASTSAHPPIWKEDQSISSQCMPHGSHLPNRSYKGMQTKQCNKLSQT